MRFLRCVCAVAASVVVWSCAHSVPEDGVAETDQTSVYPSRDAAPEASSLCTDGIKNGQETDIDCGGTCPRCTGGRTCAADTDCLVGGCSLGKCGERAWTRESTGANVALVGNQAWIPAPGLTVATALAQPGLLYLRLSGTSRWVGGGNGLCALGQRFVVDGTPTGDPTWGSAVMVQSAARAHEAFGVEVALPLAAGPHTVSVELMNGNGFGTCNLDGDGGKLYDRSRLLVSAHEPKSSWVAESTGDSGPLAVGPWTDIPGVSALFSLAASHHVQVSLAGTQYSAGTGTAHCGYRFVVDGAPLGDPNHGQAIVVGDVAAGWWAPVALKHGIDLAAGPHSIVAQVRNTGATGGTCAAGYGNSPYARFRMFAAAHAPDGLTTSAESVGGSYVLPASSPWVAVGGLAATFAAPTAGHVQFELAATQRTITSVGQCAWRYVVDGVALGDPTYGQAINMGDGAKTWWTGTTLAWGQVVAAGPHTVSVEVRNTGASDCGTNGDGLPYGRARLLVRGL